MVFGFYMAATYLGMSLGQIVLMLQSNLGITTLLVIALCFALCLGADRSHHLHQCATHVAGPDGAALLCRRHSQGAGHHVGDRHGGGLVLRPGAGLRQPAILNHSANRPVHGAGHLRRVGGAVPAQLAVGSL